MNCIHVHTLAIANTDLGTSGDDILLIALSQQSQEASQPHMTLQPSLMKQELQNLQINECMLAAHIRHISCNNFSRLYCGRLTCYVEYLDRCTCTGCITINRDCIITTGTESYIHMHQNHQPHVPHQSATNTHIRTYNNTYNVIYTLTRFNELNKSIYSQLYYEMYLQFQCACQLGMCIQVDDLPTNQES